MSHKRSAAEMLSSSSFSHKRSAADMLSSSKPIIDLTVDEALRTDVDGVDAKECQCESTQKISQESSGAPQEAGPEPTQKMEDFDGVPDSQPAVPAEDGAPRKDEDAEGRPEEKEIGAEDEAQGDKVQGDEDQDGDEEMPLLAAAASCPGEPSANGSAVPLDQNDNAELPADGRGRLMIAVIGTTDKTKATLINEWIGRDLLPINESPPCTIRIHHRDIDGIVIAEPLQMSSYRPQVTFAELYKATDYLSVKTINDDTRALDVVLRFADGCPALRETNLRPGRTTPVVEFTYVRAHIPELFVCQFLADCESLVWCEAGDSCFRSNAYTFAMGHMLVRCRPDIFRRCSVVFANRCLGLVDCKAIYSGLQKMWSSFDPHAKWPLLEPAFGDDEQVATFAFAMHGGQSVWCQSKGVPLESESILCHARAAATAPVFVATAAAEEPLIGFACARAALMGSLAFISSSIATVAQNSIEIQMKDAPQNNPHKLDMFVAKFCDGYLRRELYAKCFIPCYDTTVLAMWRAVLMLPRNAHYYDDYEPVHSLCTLPLHALGCLTWKTTYVPEFLGKSDKPLSEEDHRLALSFYRRGARSLAETLMCTLDCDFEILCF